MNRTFRFRARQNQHLGVSEALLMLFDLNVQMEKKDDHVLVTAKLPNGLSKRNVEQGLFELGVPGAQNQQRKVKVRKGEASDFYLNDMSEVGEWFRWFNTESGKFEGTFRVYTYDHGCECCGTMRTLQRKDGRILYVDL